jgi:WD40 repeat protein
VLERKGEEGFLITGGDDRFVRVWNLSDISLRREFRVNVGVPQSVALLADGRRAIFSSSAKEPPTEIEVGDIYSGSQKRLLTVNEPFVKVAATGSEFIYNSGRDLLLASSTTGETKRKFSVDAQVNWFAVSTNGQWLAVSDSNGALYRFEIANGRRLQAQTAQLKLDGRLVITNNGRYVYTTEFGGAVRRWDTQSNTLKELMTVRGIPHSLRLSTDERRLAIGGNHRDVGVYDAESGKPIGGFDVEASDFYVTNVWLRGNRLIFTTDSGVLFDGVLEQTKP